MEEFTKTVGLYSLDSEQSNPTLQSLTWERLTFLHSGLGLALASSDSQATRPGLAIWSYELNPAQMQR